MATFSPLQDNNLSSKSNWELFLKSLDGTLKQRKLCGWAVYFPKGILSHDLKHKLLTEKGLSGGQVTHLAVTMALATKQNNNNSAFIFVVSFQVRFWRHCIYSIEAVSMLLKQNSWLNVTSTFLFFVSRSSLSCFCFDCNLCLIAVIVCNFFQL